MLTLLGCPSLSPVRLSKLASFLRAHAGCALEVTADWAHFVEFTPGRAPNEAAEKRLGVLHNYGETTPAAATHAALADAFASDASRRAVWVVPRLGTQSPWSSKATDIAHVCGLTEVQRIERGVRYRLVAASALDDSTWQRVYGCLHDRMTQTVLEDERELALLFQRLEPKPAQRVDVMAGGKAALERANVELGLAL